MTIRIGLGSANQTSLDWDGNRQRLMRLCLQADRQGTNLLCLPELATTGYGCEDMFLHWDTSARALEMVREMARAFPNMGLLVGFPFWHQEKLYNGVAACAGGRIQAISAKSHLARAGIHYEPRWFDPWPLGHRDQIDIGDGPIPVGTLTYSVQGFRFGIEICEDAWVEKDQRPCGFFDRAQFVFNSSASHFSLGKAEVRERIVTHSSLVFSVGYGYCNLVGCESGRAIYDGEMMIADRGKIITRSTRLGLYPVKLLTHDWPYAPHAIEGAVVLEVPQRERGGTVGSVQARVFPTREEEFAAAASLGLWDYLRKSHQRGFVLSLSGGADSACVAVLVWVLAHRMLELDQASLRESYPALTRLEQWPRDPCSWVNVLLQTAYQATRNSSNTTREAALHLAQAIGARHFEFDVDAIVAAYQKMVADGLGRPLSWEQDDVALQNVQARSRAPGVWMLANIGGRLLLSTSNRSEVAVGYATMDGDTCGGLAPIAGVQKSYVRRWLGAVESGDVPGLPPLRELRYINAQQPTAELRPVGEGQTDEDDLMPYPVLDQLERLLTKQRMGPIAAFQTLVEKGVGSIEQAHTWTRKFYRLFAVSQWKRERYAPAFHLDDQNLDPKTWARYPILSGAYRRELEELDTHVRNLNR